MKWLLQIVLCIGCFFGNLLSTPIAEASVDFSTSYEHLSQPNVGNNYDDGVKYGVGLRHDVYKKLEGRIDAVHFTDIDFPTASDPKGSFGELRGFGGIYTAILNLTYNKNVAFNINAGTGPVWWDFRENPNFQDAGVKVKVSPSWVFNVGIGVGVKIYDNWHVDLGIGWMDTNIEKHVISAGGEELNQLDADSNLGLQYKTYRIAVRREF